MKCRERQLGFRVDTGAPQHAHAFRMHGGVLEQSRLADACLAADDERIASTGASVVEQAQHGGALDLAAVEQWLIVRPAIEGHGITTAPLREARAPSSSAPMSSRSGARPHCM